MRSGCRAEKRGARRRRPPGRGGSCRGRAHAAARRSRLPTRALPRRQHYKRGGKRGASRVPRDATSIWGFDRGATRLCRGAPNVGGLEERPGCAGALRTLGGSEERPGCAGALRTLGGLEERPGCAGALRTLGGVEERPGCAAALRTVGGNGGAIWG